MTIPLVLSLLLGAGLLGLALRTEKRRGNLLLYFPYCLPGSPQRR